MRATEFITELFEPKQQTWEWQFRGSEEAIADFKVGDREYRWDALGIDLLKNPDLAGKPEVAAKIAVWYWNTRVKPKINNFADTMSVTKLINPAFRGVKNREENFKDYMKELYEKTVNNNVAINSINTIICMDTTCS